VGQVGLGKIKADLHRARRKGLHKNVVGQMAGAGLGQGAVQRDNEAVRVQILFFKAFGGAFRPHGVGAGRACADSV